MNNLAFQDDYRDEILNGQPVAMSPRPSVNHSRVTGNIYRIFGNYLQGKKCEAFPDGVDVYLTEKDRIIPDMMVICNKDIIKPDGIYGAPDLIVEVLSPSTAKRDKGYKKELYEKCGVKEYWIVDVNSRSIDVYQSTDGKFTLENVYIIFPDYTLKNMTEEEKADIITEFKSSLFDDLTINLFDVFENMV